MKWPDDAETITAWALGDTVDAARLAAELAGWEDYLAASVALWPDSTVTGDRIDTSGDDA